MDDPALAPDRGCRSVPSLPCTRSLSPLFRVPQSGLFSCGPEPSAAGRECRPAELPIVLTYVYVLGATTRWRARGGKWKEEAAGPSMN